MFLEKKRRQQKSRKLHTKLEIKKMPKTFRSRFKFLKKLKIIKMQEFDSISQKILSNSYQFTKIEKYFPKLRDKKLIDRLSEIFIRTRIVQF